MKIQKQKNFLKLQEIYDAVVGEVKSSSLSKILKEKTLLGIKVMRFCEKKNFFGNFHTSFLMFPTSLVELSAIEALNLRKRVLLLKKFLQISIICLLYYCVTKDGEHALVTVFINLWG